MIFINLPNRSGRTKPWGLPEALKMFLGSKSAAGA
jgi:hypothetical protein